MINDETSVILITNNNTNQRLQPETRQNPDI